MANALPLLISVPTSGGGQTAAATFVFFTSGYRQPRRPRASSVDVVKNQNGEFRYRYDNGPLSRIWQPFRIFISDRFEQWAGSATQQQANLEFLWEYTEGPLQLGTPFGTYNVDWAGAPLEPETYGYPQGVGDKLDWAYTVNFEEA